MKIDKNLLRHEEKILLWLKFKSKPRLFNKVTLMKCGDYAQKLIFKIISNIKCERFSVLIFSFNLIYFRNVHSGNCKILINETEIYQQKYRFHFMQISTKIEIFYFYDLYEQNFYVLWFIWNYISKDIFKSNQVYIYIYLRQIHFVYIIHLFLAR